MARRLRAARGGTHSYLSPFSLVAWLAVCGLVIGALGAELWLRLERRRDAPAVERLARRNAFEQGLVHGVHRSLWGPGGMGSDYRPHAFVEVELAAGPYRVVINGQGYRTREIGPKPPGTVRLLCIGASTTVQGATNETTYPALLEARLRDSFAGSPIEVLNLGVSGTRSDRWLDRLDELFAYEPDIVLQYNGANDLLLEHLPAWAAARPRDRAIRHRSLLWDRLRRPSGSDLTQALAATVDRFESIERACDARRTAYVLGSFAAPDPATASSDLLAYLDVVTERWSSGSIRHYRAYWRLLDRLDAALVAMAGREAIPVADVRARVHEARLFVDLCHMSPRGIERQAEAFHAAVAPLVTMRLQAAAAAIG